jgi:hypothetical protein
MQGRALTVAVGCHVAPVFGRTLATYVLTRSAQAAPPLILALAASASPATS